MLTTVLWLCHYTPMFDIHGYVINSNIAYSFKITRTSCYSVTRGFTNKANTEMGSTPVMYVQLR